MKFFLSGRTGTKVEVGPIIAKHVRHRLLSMHDDFKDVVTEWVGLTHHPDSAMTELMLDSGAFTAFTRGLRVKLDELSDQYEAVIKAAHSSIKHIWLINLDVIPGEWGRIARDAEIQRALDESDQNFLKLKARFGDRVLPVFHMTEPPRRFMQILAQADFVALGLRQDEPDYYRINAAAEFCESGHLRGKRVHGLATTGTKMLKRVPFDTVDSASWLYAGSMGKILYIDQDGDLCDVPISDRSPAQQIDRGHYKTKPPKEQAWIEARIHAAGFTVEQMMKDHAYRKAFNAHEINHWLGTYQRPKQEAAVVETGLFPMDQGLA